MPSVSFDRESTKFTWATLTAFYPINNDREGLVLSETQSHVIYLKTTMSFIGNVSVKDNTASETWKQAETWVDEPIIDPPSVCFLAIRLSSFVGIDHLAPSREYIWDNLKVGELQNFNTSLAIGAWFAASRLIEDQLSWVEVPLRLEVREVTIRAILASTTWSFEELTSSTSLARNYFVTREGNWVGVIDCTQNGMNPWIWNVSCLRLSVAFSIESYNIRVCAWAQGNARRDALWAGRGGSSYWTCFAVWLWVLIISVNIGSRSTEITLLRARLWPSSLAL